MAREKLEINETGQVTKITSGEVAEKQELVRALRELLELVEMSEMSCRDLEPHEYESISDDAIGRARKAIKLFGDA